MKPHKDNKVLSVGSNVDFKQTSRAIIRLRLEFQFGLYTLVTMFAGYFIRSFFFGHVVKTRGKWVTDTGPMT